MIGGIVFTGSGPDITSDLEGKEELTPLLATLPSPT